MAIVPDRIDSLEWRGDPPIVCPIHGTCLHTWREITMSHWQQLLYSNQQINRYGLKGATTPSNTIVIGQDTSKRRWDDYPADSSN